MVFEEEEHGITQRSLEFVRSVLPKLTTPIQSIYGYHNLGIPDEERVSFYTSTGDEIITNGFCWGYHGEGPRGLETISREVGFHGLTIETIASIPRSSAWVYSESGLQIIS